MTMTMTSESNVILPSTDQTNQGMMSMTNISASDVKFLPITVLFVNSTDELTRKLIDLQLKPGIVYVVKGDSTDEKVSIIMKAITDLLTDKLPSGKAPSGLVDGRLGISDIHHMNLFNPSKGVWAVEELEYMFGLGVNPVRNVKSNSFMQGGLFIWNQWFISDRLSDSLDVCCIADRSGSITSEFEKFVEKVRNDAVTN